MAKRKYTKRGAKAKVKNAYDVKFKSYMGNKGDNYVIEKRGNGEFANYVITNQKTFSMIDMFFDSKDEAIKYADKRGLIIVDTFKDGGAIPIDKLKSALNNKHLPASAIEKIKQLIAESESKSESKPESNPEILKSRLKLIKKMNDKKPSPILKARIKLIEKMLMKKMAKGGPVSSCGCN